MCPQDRFAIGALGLKIYRFSSLNVKLTNTKPGWWFQPLWKIWVRQWDGLSHMLWKRKVMFETTNQHTHWNFLLPSLVQAQFFRSLSKTFRHVPTVKIRIWIQTEGRWNDNILSKTWRVVQHIKWRQFDRQQQQSCWAETLTQSAIRGKSCSHKAKSATYHTITRGVNINKSQLCSCELQKCPKFWPIEIWVPSQLCLLVYIIDIIIDIIFTPARLEINQLSYNVRPPR